LEVDLPEQRIGEISFNREKTGPRRRGEIAQIECIGLRQPQQDLRRTGRWLRSIRLI